jgi:hypothetical protein
MVWFSLYQLQGSYRRDQSAGFLSLRKKIISGLTDYQQIPISAKEYCYAIISLYY